MLHRPEKSGMYLSKTSLTRLLVIVGFIGLVCSLVLLFHFTLEKPAQSNPDVPPASLLVAKPVAAAIDLPTRLTIPSINVNALVEHVGLTANGEMDTPENPNNVAWYKAGPRPGENGSAVIDGHYGRANGGRGAFDNLHRLRAGDKLYVEDTDGLIIAFVVHTLQTYRRDDDAQSVFVSSDSKSHLNLITCAGSWNTATRNYSDRTVVFTDRE
ncbi:MAG: peptidase family protein [Candidatus Saccharibacteria bacterium]|nr:peptidase family protein [Candidatus Saccharibacteria bacterium]